MYKSCVERQETLLRRACGGRGDFFFFLEGSRIRVRVLLRKLLRTKPCLLKCASHIHIYISSHHYHSPSGLFFFCVQLGDALFVSSFQPFVCLVIFHSPLRLVCPLTLPLAYHGSVLARKMICLQPEFVFFFPLRQE